MVYLDNAASTRPSPEVLDEVRATAAQHFANPSSAHRLGAEATRVLERARAQVAALVGAEPRQVVFTSGGTEANALGVIGPALAGRGRHVVVSAIEHPAVLRSADWLARRGYTVTLVKASPDGAITSEDLLAAIRAETVLVAVMLVNNELGTVQPVGALARALRERGDRVHLHVDGVQAVGILPVALERLGADSLALSGHKFHGPRGAGALVLSPRARLEPLWGGGGQERGLRSGSENLPAIAGLGRAAESARTTLAPQAVARLRDQLEDEILAAVPDARPTVRREVARAPHIASVRLPGLPAEPILHALEARGVFAAAGSACASRQKGQSHVLAAIGVRDDDAVLRFSLARDSREDDARAAARALADAVAEVSTAVSGRSYAPGKRATR